jgi:hypothetical protein
VRGLLFLDYVRMIRGHKRVDWTPYLQPEDRELLAQPIDVAGWYPMETFERLGIAIVREIARGQLMAVRMWGRFQIEMVRSVHPTLVADDDPRETLLRFQTLRHAFFDYDALDVVEVRDDRGTVGIAYGMGAEAEEAACVQTMGFCERLVEMAGARDVVADFRARGWLSSPRTLVDLRWK